ncbi:MAG: arginine--tRNA ligase [Bacteriovoracaceae bacterium]|nr:arginine--tRNA ligase [Bacteriovoracaceae bacterium]
MANLPNKIIEQISTNIHQAILAGFGQLPISPTDVYEAIGSPPNVKMGHLAFPCFNLAKMCKSSPKNIAQELVKFINSSPLIKEVKNFGPYLNFFLNFEPIGPLVLEDILNQSIFEGPLVANSKKIMFEYSQPNTHKELHVGHMRNLCLGNALVRLNRYIGNEVTAATYPGDVGTHVAKCLWYLKYRNQTPPPETGKGPWLGKLYSLACQQLEKELGTSEEEQNRSLLTSILKEIESQSGPHYELWQTTRQWSIDLMKEVYKWADVDFDRWYFESEVDSPSIMRAKEFYQQGLYIESDGAIGVDLSQDKLGFCMMIKSDGTGLYATKDIDLAYKKFEEFNLDQSVYIVDTRQSYHFNQVFKVLEKINFPHAQNCHHLDYDFVELPSGAMSSRKGDIVPLTDLIDQMQNTIKREYLSRYEGQWSSEQINETANIVAQGAIKYGMLRVDNGRKIVFNMQEWLKLDGETGPYLQYVHARIVSLCEKQNYDPKIAIDWSLLNSASEQAVMLKLSQFNTTALTAATTYKTALMCSYLYELGKLFNNFYIECPIGKASSTELKNARLALAKSCGQIMGQGLALLGIKAPNQM